MHAAGGYSCKKPPFGGIAEYCRGRVSRPEKEVICDRSAFAERSRRGDSRIARSGPFTDRGMGAKSCKTLSKVRRPCGVATGRETRPLRCENRTVVGADAKMYGVRHNDLVSRKGNFRAGGARKNGHMRSAVGAADQVGAAIGRPKSCGLQK